MTFNFIKSMHMDIYYDFQFYKIDANGHFSYFSQINHHNDFKNADVDKNFLAILKIADVVKNLNFFSKWAFVASLVILTKKIVYDILL